MALENHSDHMEDNRFREVKKFKKKELPVLLQWFAGEDYFFEEVIGLHSSEISKFKFIGQEAYNIFEKATDKIIQEKNLHLLNIPSYFHQIIEKTWNDRQNHPLLYGRFDINGGINERHAKVIEFNADTCSTLPETILWQKLQLAEIKAPMGQFNNLDKDLETSLAKLKRTIPFEKPYFLASSFGHKEDKLNCDMVLNAAHKAGFDIFYTDLENVTFSDEGIFVEIGGEFQPVDVWFKMIPWDWIFNEEQELARTLIDLINKDLTKVLNPPYTAVWQNKLFLNYITQHFPNTFIAETYDNPSLLSGKDYVEKPIYGRMGENVKFSHKNVEVKGDFAQQRKIYQRYYPLEKDQENYYFQLGLFYTFQPSAINFRAEDQEIITNNCEFVSHFII